MVHLDGLQSERLLFRKLEESDLTDLMPFFSDPKSTQYFPPIDDPKVFGNEWIIRQLNRYHDSGYGLMALELIETNDLVGMAGIVPQEIEGKLEYEIGYHLIPKYWKNGYAIEAAQRIKEYLKANEICTYTISIIHKENQASIAVARKNGMTLLIDNLIMKNLPVQIFKAVL